jgi:hypothetical protein
MKFNIGRRVSLLILGWLLGYPITLQMNSSAVMAAPLKLKLPPPPHRGIAGNRSSAASRDTCPTVAQPLTALVPEYHSKQGNQIWGLTGMEHPTLLFYVPYTKASIVDMSFTLQDESDPTDTKIVYQNSTITPTANPGVMRIVLPKSIAPLAANKPYHWFMKLNMSCRNGQRPMFVDGWVQRIEIDNNLSEQIDRATSTEKVSLYANNGLAYDAISTLASLRSTKPQDTGLSQEWQNLLDSIELGYLANQPLSDNSRFSGRQAPSRNRVQQLRSTAF